MRTNIKHGFFFITVCIMALLLVGGCSSNQICINRECNLLDNQMSIHEIYSYIEEENKILYSKKGIDINNATETLDCFHIDIDNEDGQLTPHYIQYKTYIQDDGVQYILSVDIHKNSFISALAQMDDRHEIKHIISPKDFIAGLDSINLDYFMNELEYGDKYILECMRPSKTISNHSSEYNSYITYSYENIRKLGETDEITFESYKPVISIVSLKEVENNTFESGNNSYLLVCLAN